MGYSSIIRKPCKCGCGRPPSIGYAGYNMLCRPDLIKNKVDKIAAKSTQTKLRSDTAQENKLLPNKAKEDFEKKEQWFTIVRRKLTGTCQCGCRKPSSKNDDKHFRSSCCHLFPKRIFKSIQYHPHNYIERAFWGGCHTNLDEQGMDLWPKMADWEVMKEKFHELAPLLTDEERKTKFYTTFEKLVYAN